MLYFLTKVVDRIKTFTKASLRTFIMRNFDSLWENNTLSRGGKSAKSSKKRHKNWVERIPEGLFYLYKPLSSQIFYLPNIQTKIVFERMAENLVKFKFLLQK